jgi:hypothetical protein
MHTTGHYGVANSYAMKLVGITRETKDPLAGTIDRDQKGNPTGVLKESATDLVTARIPAYTREQEKSGLLKIIADFNQEGMTGAKDPGIEPEEWSLYRELQAESKLTVRVFALFLAGTTLDSAHQTLRTLTGLPRPPQSFDGRLLAGGVKIFMDGSGGARTAWMHQEWNKNSTAKDTGNYGYPALDPEVYRQQVKMFHDAGIHVSTHAVGDRAIDWVVDTYAEVLQAKPTRGLRHGIIHCNTPTDHARDDGQVAEPIRCRVPGGTGAFHVVDRRQLRGQLRTGALPSADAFPHISCEGHSVGRRVRLLGDAISGALRSLGVGGEKHAQGCLRQAAFRPGRGYRRARGTSLVYDLGSAPVVSGGPNRLDRAGKGCRHRSLGPRPIHDAGRRNSEYQMRANAGRRAHSLPGGGCAGHSPVAG